jgi:hypothetical protein
MARPMPAKDRAARIAVICNLTDLYSVEQRNYGVFAVHPVIAGLQYVVRCKASLELQQKKERGHEAKILPGGGARKEIIAQCEPGEEYALTELADATAVRQEMGGPDGQNNTLVHEPMPAYDTADDIVRSLNKNMAIGGVGADGIEGFCGIFVCNDDRPTAQELKSARERLQKCDEAMVQRADTDFAFYKNPMFCVEAIPSAKRLKIEDRDWLSVYKPSKECPMCFTKVDPRAVVCRSCNFVIDRKAAITAGFLEPVPEPAKPHKSA